MWWKTLRPVQPVAVVRLSLFNTCLLFILLGFINTGVADPRLLKLQQHTAFELKQMLLRADELAASTRTLPDQPIVLILHGAEASLFLRSQYDQNRELVGLAAKLDALRVMDMKICETWMLKSGISRRDVPDFIESVPLAEAEEARLEAAGYQSF